MEGLIPGEWVKLFEGVDIPLMFAIGVVAFVLERSQRVGEGITVFVPLALGAIVGLVTGLERQSQDGASIMTHILKGVILNGAGASVMARAANFALAKFWDSTDTHKPVVMLALTFASSLMLQSCAVPKILQPGEQVEQDVRFAASTLCAVLPPAQQEDARNIIEQARHWSDLVLYQTMSSPNAQTRETVIFGAVWWLARRVVDAESIADAEAWKAAVGHQLRIALDACGGALGMLA